MLSFFSIYKMCAMINQFSASSFYPKKKIDKTREIKLVKRDLLNSQHVDSFDYCNKLTSRFKSCRMTL